MSEPLYRKHYSQARNVAATATDNEGNHIDDGWSIYKITPGGQKELVAVVDTETQADIVVVALTIASRERGGVLSFSADAAKHLEDLYVNLRECIARVTFEDGTQHDVRLARAPSEPELAGMCYVQNWLEHGESQGTEGEPYWIDPFGEAVGKNVKHVKEIYFY